MVNLEKYKQTAIKAGITGLVTSATYFGVDFLEDMATNNFLNQALDLVQSAATIAVPYLMANKYMRKKGDSSLIRYATQIIPMLFVPEVFKDIDFIVPSGFREHYLSTIGEYPNYLRTIGAAVPFLGDAKRALEKD